MSRSERLGGRAEPCSLPCGKVSWEISVVLRTWLCWKTASSAAEHNQHHAGVLQRCLEKLEHAVSIKGSVSLKGQSSLIQSSFGINTKVCSLLLLLWLFHSLSCWKQTYGAQYYKKKKNSCWSPQRQSLFVSGMSQKSCWQIPIKIGQEEEKIKLIFLPFFLSNELMDPFEWNHMSPTSVHHCVYFMEQRSNITNLEDFASFAEVCTRLCCDYFFSPL